MVAFNHIPFLEHLQDSLYFISTLSLFQQLFIYLKSNTLQHYSLFYLYFYYFILTFFFFSLLISCLPPQSIEIDVNHHHRLPPVSHPCHKHLKIGNPQPQTATSKSLMPQTPQDWQPHNHTHGSTTTPRSVQTTTSRPRSASKPTASKSKTPDEKKNHATKPTAKKKSCEQTQPPPLQQSRTYNQIFNLMAWF